MGISAMDSPGTFSASTCSRPLADVLKMRTLPRTMMCSPLQGSPSENSNSPALNNLRTVRAASKCSSGCVRLENNAVFSSTAERSARGAVTGEFYQQATFVTALPAGLNSDRVMHPRSNAIQRKNRRMVHGWRSRLEQSASGNHVGRGDRSEEHTSELQSLRH